MKSAATYLKKTPEHNYAVCRELGSKTLTWLRGLDARNKQCIKAVAVLLWTADDGVPCAGLTDFELDESYTPDNDCSALLGSLDALCSTLYPVVPKDQKFVVFFCKNEERWDIYAEAGHGGPVMAEHFSTAPTEAFELTVHNLEEVS